MTPVAEQVASINEEFKKLNAEFGRTLEQQREDIQRLGGTTTQTSNKIESIEERMASMGEAMSEIQEKLNSEEGLRSAPAGGDPRQRMHRASRGNQFLSSDEYKEKRSRNAFNTDPVDVEPFFSQRWVTSEPTGIGAAGGLIEPQKLPGITMDPQRTFIMRDLLNVVPVESPQIEIMRLAGFYNLSTKLTATAASAQAAVTVESTAGFMVGQVVTLRQATGAATESKTILTINNTTNVITMSTNLSAGFAVGDFLTAGEFGATAHGARKPQMNLAFTEDIVNCITLAHWTPAHRQTLDDVPVMRNLIDTELVYGLALTEEWQILQGPGTGGNLLGFMNNTLIQNQGTMTGAGIQQLDWVRKALTKSLIADYPPNGIVVNPIDWEAIELLKDSQGRYLYLDINPGREPNIWKIPAVVSNSMPVNNFLLGAFALGADLYDRETTTIRFAEQHEDYVVRNAVLVLAEERIGLGVKRPLSFVKGRFA